MRSMMHSLVRIVVIASVLCSGAFADTYVQGYVRRDGVYVKPHMRRSPTPRVADTWSKEPKPHASGRTLMSTPRRRTDDPFRPLRQRVIKPPSYPKPHRYSRDTYPRILTRVGSGIPEFKPSNSVTAPKIRAYGPLKGLSRPRKPRKPSVPGMPRTPSANISLSFPSTPSAYRPRRDPSVNEPVPSPAETVYVTESGGTYHRAGCRYLKSGGAGISASEASTHGYKPCKVCKP